MTVVTEDTMQQSISLRIEVLNVTIGELTKTLVALVALPYLNLSSVMYDSRRTMIERAANDIHDVAQSIRKLACVFNDTDAAN